MLYIIGKRFKMLEKVKVFLIALVGALLVICMLFQAAVHESLKLYPPTAEEIAEEPALERYVHD